MALSGDEIRGAAISSYHLQWDKGTSTWEDLAGLTADYTSLEFLVTSDILPGQAYKFRVKAKNAHGWATAWSPEGTVYAKAKPGVINTLTTAVQDAVNVRISWDAPLDNSDTITAYEILIS